MSPNHSTLLLHGCIHCSISSHVLHSHVQPLCTPFPHGTLLPLPHQTDMTTVHFTSSVKVQCLQRSTAHLIQFIQFFSLWESVKGITSCLQTQWLNNSSENQDVCCESILHSSCITWSCVSWRLGQCKWLVWWWVSSQGDAAGLD